ncbi:hypothetical protein KKC83_01380 [Patescibacteria group bacterium]|nr:hypothetical protein [Candidatus Falkowbacteria bacterium]MBU3905393.1 hypothetical protein [Patescibacteria group bacterium]MBU4015733.1 hypothetical protein [Patescibacteria group bacterium]MBU4026179.1 hypothetical protein [Patescibacteria group bacterium]MBU4072500.1 hypothetical protein [Patescibacteria group bacterium]
MKKVFSMIAILIAVLCFGALPAQAGGVTYIYGGASQYLVAHVNGPAHEYQVLNSGGGLFTPDVQINFDMNAMSVQNAGWRGSVDTSTWNSVEFTLIDQCRGEDVVLVAAAASSQVNASHNASGWADALSQIVIH